MAKDAQLQGPHAFPLARLTMIFRVLLRNETPDEDLDALDPANRGAAGTFRRWLLRR